jgi:PAS domain S-box-containing protein
MRDDRRKGYRIGPGSETASDGTLPLAQPYALQSAGNAFHALANTMPQIVWSTLPDGSHDYYNAQWYDFTGVAAGSTDGEGWANLFHPEDQPHAWALWRRSLETGEPYEVEYRLRHRSGEYQWMIGRALPIFGENGAIQRWIGTCTNVEEQKQVALMNEVLSQELSHRIKNIFAIIAGLISLTARAHGQMSEVARELLGRIAALGRAHEYVRPHSEHSRQTPEDITLSQLIEKIFAFYPAWGEGRITISGDDMEIGSRAATPVALVLHELATNAMKHGALATNDGRIDLDLEDLGENVRLRWTETGTPRKPDKETRPGFGSRLIDLAVKQQLGGDYARNWLDDGLELALTIRKERIQAA